MALSTHVLNLSTGQPAMGIKVSLSKEGVLLGEGITDSDGRFADFVEDANLAPGQYQLNFDVADFFSGQALEAFYSTIPVVFVVKDGSRHHHVPLLLSPYGYSTYRGS